MYALVINCGSSSLKFALIHAKERNTVISGGAEQLDTPDATLTIKYHGEKIKNKLEDPTHLGAFKETFQFLQKEGYADKIKAVGHRVVHGGEYFQESVEITPEVIEIIKKCAPLAPIHNPANLTGILAAKEVLPELPQIAVFDTAFHQTMPEEAYLYGLPLEIYEKYNIRRYGFHGSSHRYITERTSRILDIPLEKLNIISCHLGNGASIAAIRGGKSVDTSMGLTPLEGLMMGTRSGSLDPGLIPYLVECLDYDIYEMDNLLNFDSGLLGISGVSNDCRTLEAKAKEGHKRCRLALDMFGYRVAKTISEYLPALQRLDAIVFTGGIGENSAYVRELIMSQLAFLGYRFSNPSNSYCTGGKEGVIATSSNFGKALVVCTDEEGMIVQDTLEIIAKKEKQAS
ncbi:acetate kinase [Ignatzschineria indica]|uniref:acetate/propionate family kinase n=1 Tax=Ignatzschineria indica TaxID=472583 RepID=UPI0025767928|nr:acetate kinase [Ignatzschineria indica]MDM1545699.1 acetate kinase [Ignatzschineria indica]